VDVREALGAERHACRMLLAGQTDDLGWSRLTVAVERGSGLVLGAAAACPRLHSSGEVHAWLAVRVVAPSRRRGIATSLLAELAADARTRKCAALVAHADEEEGVSFLAARGFRASERLMKHRARVGPLAEALAELEARARRRGRVPPGARVVPLGPLAVAALAAMQATLVGGTREGASERLAALAADPAWSLTRVLEVDGAPQGLVAARRSGDACAVPSHFIARHLQACEGSSGWPALVLLARSLGDAHALGVESCSFECLETNRPMTALADRLGAECVGARELRILRI
jgi:GNAT superfamily N-acetyltransferase